MSLKEPNLKMSKSHEDPRSRILLNDSPAVIWDKVRLALTDSIAGVSYDPIKRPGVSNLLTLMKYLDTGSPSIEKLAEVNSTLGMREFKETVAVSISKGLADVRMQYNRLINDDSKMLRDIATEGAEIARSKANKTIRRVKDVTGL